MSHNSWLWVQGLELGFGLGLGLVIASLVVGEFLVPFGRLR